MVTPLVGVVVYRVSGVLTGAAGGTENDCAATTATTATTTRLHPIENHWTTDWDVATIIDILRKL